MADDTETTLTLIDGTSTPRPFYATQNAGTGYYTLESTPRVNGAQVDLTNPLPSLTKPMSYTLVPLAVTQVTTGGTAVTALAAGQRTAGGWILNPVTATTNLGVNEIGTATGTVSLGSTVFITPGQTYTLAPSTNAVSVISSDSSHGFAGMGYQ